MSAIFVPPSKSGQILRWIYNGRLHHERCTRGNSGKSQVGAKGFRVIIFFRETRIYYDSSLNGLGLGFLPPFKKVASSISKFEDSCLRHRKIQLVRANNQQPGSSVPFFNPKTAYSRTYLINDFLLENRILRATTAWSVIISRQPMLVRLITMMNSFVTSAWKGMYDLDWRVFAC